MKKTSIINIINNLHLNIHNYIHKIRISCKTPFLCLTYFSFYFLLKTGQNLDYLREGKERREIRENIKAEIYYGTVRNPRGKKKD